MYEKKKVIPPCSKMIHYEIIRAGTTDTAYEFSSCRKGTEFMTN
jgi:hypothetical protein